MKTRHLFYLLLVVCFSCACTNDDLNIPEINEQKTEVKEEVKIEKKVKAKEPAKTEGPILPI